MFNKIFSKVSNKVSFYKQDLKSKGLYWSVIHRLYKLPKVKKLILPIVDYLKPKYLIIDGHKFFIDKRDTTVSQELILSGKWEEYETSLFKRKIKKGDVVLDIGAHIGYYTLIAADIVGDKGKVYAFEPDPKNFTLLERNVHENGYKNVVLVNKAVAEETGSLRLYLNTENTGDHRIYKASDKRKSIKIQAITIDDFFKDKNKKVNMIKMDIQGSEVRAFKGALKLIRQNQNIKILTEFWPYGLKLSGSSAKEYVRLLVNNNFRLFDLDEIKKKKTEINDNELLYSSDSGVDSFRYLFCLKN